MVRKPAVAGQFYPADKDELKEMISSFLEKAGEIKAKPKAAVSPHAGYIYSGQTAAYSYSALKNTDPRTIVIIGPNHTGLGSLVSISTQDWETPLGIIETDKEKANFLAEKGFAIDQIAHEYEHSIEVQLPFLQVIFENFKILPICVMDQSYQTMKKLGSSLAEVLEKNDIIIASSDFTHYEPQESAFQKDNEAIKKIEQLDDEGFYKLVEEKEMSICGYGCILSAMIFSKQRDVKKAKLLKYSTSGDINGDYFKVVGYASIIFE